MESLAPSDGLPLRQDLPLTGISCADARDDCDGDGSAADYHLTDDEPGNIASNPANDADSGASVADAGGDDGDDAVMMTKSGCLREQISNSRARKTTMNWPEVTAAPHLCRCCSPAEVCW